MTALENVDTHSLRWRPTPKWTGTALCTSQRRSRIVLLPALLFETKKTLHYLWLRAAI